MNGDFHRFSKSLVDGRDDLNLYNVGPHSYVCWFINLLTSSLYPP